MIDYEREVKAAAWWGEVEEAEAQGTNDGPVVRIHADADCTSPREWDNMAEFIFYHPRYDLGDYKFRSAFEMIKDAREIGYDPAVIIQVKLFDHSGLRLYQTGTDVDVTRPDYARWDSTVVGVALINKDKARKEFGWAYITAKRRARLMEILRGELEAYSQYINGECYGYVIEDPETGEEFDACWGFIGYDNAVDAANEAMGAVTNK